MKTSFLPFSHMYQQVLFFLKSNITLMDYPAVKTIVPNMEQHGASLEKLVDIVDCSVCEDPEIYVEVVNSKGYQLGKCLENIATQKGDKAMVKRVHLSYSDLIRKSTSNKIQSASSILNEAKPFITDLADYEIAKEDIDSFEAAIMKLAEINTQNARNAAERRIKQLQQIDVLQRCKDDLKSCDSFMETIRLQHPDIYKTYHEQRKEKDNPAIYSRIRVVDADTSTPVLDALVTVTSTTSTKNDEHQVVLKRRTGPKGEVRISNSDKGNFDVVAEKIGCTSANGKLVITDSRPVTLELSLKKLHIS
jgi:hypothetical protein